MASRAGHTVRGYQHRQLLHVIRYMVAGGGLVAGADRGLPRREPRFRRPPASA